MRRMPFAEMATTRNPWPARGAEVFSLDELRHYLRKFWEDPVYGICQVSGAKPAFLRACHIPVGYFKKLFIDDPPGQQYLSARMQRRISKHVLNVLTGKIHYETNLKRVRYAVGVYDPHGVPPASAPPIVRETRFILAYNQFGPRIARLPIGG